jgi:hypothetical protein
MVIRMMYGTELQGIHGAFNETDKVHGCFCNRTDGVTYYAANGTLNTKLERDSRSGKIMVLTVKF